jgi:hypothetical protein
VFVAVGDFRGHGMLDLATANYASDTASVLLGNGDGTFQPHLDYGTGRVPDSVAVGDFNGDGKLDLVVTNAFSNTVGIMPGNGDGTFQPEVDYRTDNAPVGVAVADFNGDGKLDLVTSNLGFGTTSTVSVFLGNGDGTFQAHADYVTGRSPYSVAGGDFNGDGKPDLVTANGVTPNSTVSVLRGNGDGTFQAHADYVTGEDPVWVAVGDFNRDGKPDLVTANNISDTVSVLLGNGDGTFQPHVDYGAGLGPRAVAVSDFNGDGKLDLATANYTSNTVGVLLGNGDGIFQAHVDYRTHIWPTSVAVGDFNRDGAPDLVTTNGNSTASVLLNTGGTFVATASSANPSKLGQPVTFTTTVTASLQGVGTPTGTVTFKDGTLTLGTASLVSGQASLTTSRLNVGDRKIRAQYSGDSTFNPHRAIAIIQKVRR